MSTLYRHLNVVWAMLICLATFFLYTQCPYLSLRGRPRRPLYRRWKRDGEQSNNQNPVYEERKRTKAITKEILLINTCKFDTMTFKRFKLITIAGHTTMQSVLGVYYCLQNNTQEHGKHHQANRHAYNGWLTPNKSERYFL